MADYNLVLFEDQLGASGKAVLPGRGVNRLVYVASGAAAMTTAQGALFLSENTAWCSPAMTLIDSAKGATLLRWELRPSGVVIPDPPGENGTTRRVLAASVALDPQQSYLMRGDRVDFPIGGVAYRHTHQGPGIRRLLHGSMRIETQGANHDYAPGEAWFESGPDPVFAAASTREETAFARCMILPVILKGKSSIRYVDAADTNKPKTQRYQVFIDFPIQL